MNCVENGTHLYLTNLTYHTQFNLGRTLIARKKRMMEAAKAEASAPRPMTAAERMAMARGRGSADGDHHSSSSLPSLGGGSGGVLPRNHFSTGSIASFRAMPAAATAAAGQTPVRGSVRLAELLKPLPPGPVPSGPSGQRPESGRFVSTSGQQAHSHTAGTPLLVGDGGGGSGGSTLTGLAAVMAARVPPIVLRVSLPPPHCDFPHIASKVSIHRIHITLSTHSLQGQHPLHTYHSVSFPFNEAS